jgi:hypothetical protein|tara:strand:+ start:1610 stop:1999 length:390 start_codon:yes stop_codon:yes gene_type:complete
MNIIAYNNNETMIGIGKNKIANNEFMKDLSELMENEKFVNFYKKYMCDWNTLKCTSIYMRLYSEFQNKYLEISGEKLDKHIIIFLLSKIMTDSKLRPISIKTIEKLQKDHTIDFFLEFEKFITSSYALE